MGEAISAVQFYLGSHPDVETSSSSAAKKAYKHACERCRTSKLKCSLETVKTTGKCDRCLKSQTDCVFEPLAPRQRRKRTDARVTSLEKELRAMKSMLNNLQDSQSTSDQTPPPSAQNTASSAKRVAQEGLSQNVDSLTKDLIPDSLAAQLFKDFFNLYLPQYPFVEVMDDFDNARESKPILTLAAIAAASGSRDPDLFKKLHTFAMRAVMEKAILQGERSVELVQSILILALWYYPQDDLRRLNFYQSIHIAGTMALQLGLGGKTNDHDIEFSNHYIENWRTMFAVYESCSSVALSLRRQRMIDFTEPAQKCLTVFEGLCTSLEDKRLVAWVKLQRIAEDVDNMRSNASRQEAENDWRRIEDRFIQWEQSLEPGILNASLNVHLYYCKAKFFGSMLYLEQDLEALVPPYLNKVSPTGGCKVSITPAYVKAVFALIDSCHGILNTIIALDDSLLRGCPAIIFARSLYALKSLAILRWALQYPQHTISGILDEETLKISSIARALVEKLRSATGDERCRVPSMILIVIPKIVGQNPEMEQSSRNRANNGQPVSNPQLAQDSQHVGGAETGQHDIDPVAPLQEAPSVSGPNTGSSDMPYAMDLEGQELSDMALLTEFDAIIHPDFAPNLDGMHGFSSWDNSAFGGNWF